MTGADNDVTVVKLIDDAEEQWIANNPQSARFRDFEDGINWLRYKYDLVKFFTIQQDFRIVYSYAVTLLEAFFSETAKYVVSNDKKAFINSAKYLDETDKRKYKLEQVAANSIKKLVLTRVSELTFHNTKTIKEFFSKVLETEIDLPELGDVINTRHDIVHRNGKTRGNEDIVLTIADIKNALTIIEGAASYVHERVLKLDGIK